ncbi:MAG: TonB-dependent receptor [Caulobacter sp.]|nr:TonB-dependent receptor [Caulobacter sp.]
MKTHTTRGRLLASTMICGAAFAALATAAPAFAQDEAGAEVDAVVVTGSRIARQDFVANSPISTVSAEDIRATGDLNTEELLNALPQVVPGLTAASNNPSDGTATVDLRGVGPSRTLVLINGRRVNPSTRSNTVDLNNIPTRLIKQVEVVTGGASAVYGSDALSGVVNFTLKDDFEGIELTTQYGLSKYSDGEQSDTSIIFGANVAEGRGNVTGYFSYYDRDRILPNSDRPDLQISNAGGSGTGIRGGLNNVTLNCFGSVDPAGVGPAGPCGTYLATSRRSFNANGTVRPFVNDFSLAPTSDRYNFTSVNNLLSPAERFNIALLGHYDITSNVTAFAEVLYTDSRNSAQLAPTPATGIQIPFNNAFITDPSPGTITTNSLRDLLNSRANPTAPLFFDRRMAEVGARIESRDSDLWQVNTGLRADLGNGWKADGYVSYGRTEFNVQIQNDVSRSKLNAALTSTNGTSCSAAALALFPGCVPINLFGEGTITDEAANFVRLDFKDNTIFERYIAQVNVSGTLFTLPAGDLAVAFGTEYREETLTFNPDAAKASGDIFGFNAERPVGGSQNVGEIYGEAVIPILADLPAVHYLGLEVGARWSDYSSVGNVTSYKIGGEYAPIEGLRFRAMFNVASRAPSVFELFQAGDQGFPAVVDPCTTINPATGDVVLDGTDLSPESVATRAFCTAQLGFDPVTNNFVALNTQTESFFFGNPGLTEEKSETVTVGVVWTPTFAPGLSVSLDYYDIKIEDYIGIQRGGVTGIVGACFASLDLNSPECNDPGIGLPLIFRDAAGNLKARAPLGNVSALQTKGIDFAVSYGWNVPWAGDMWGDRLQLDLVLTHLDEYVLDNIDYAGTVGVANISAALPEWKANIRAGYDVGPVRLSYNGTYIGEMENQGNLPAFGGPSNGYIGTDAVMYHDVNARWSVTDSVSLFGGIKNLSDEDPQVFDNAPDGNTDPNTFDILGRYYYVGATLRF